MDTFETIDGIFGKLKDDIVKREFFAETDLDAMLANTKASIIHLVAKEMDERRCALVRRACEALVSVDISCLERKKINTKL